MLRQLKQTQIINADISKAWGFFSNPKNLPFITPANLNLRITSDFPEEIYQGLLISYKVTPLFKIPLNWVTEITAVDKPNYFVDEQIVGPYKIWHHEHFFREVDEGVEIEDRVSYLMPFEPLGSIVHALIVKKQLKEIFKYRENVLNEFFNS